MMSGQKVKVQLGREKCVPFPPQRIVSLVPSQTELLHELGLGERVVGITKFCVHPEEWFRTKTRVGGTKDVKLDVVRSLCPDLIIANREENVKEQIDTLAKEFPVYVTDVDNLNAAFQMMLSIAELTDTLKNGAKVVHSIAEQFASIKPQKERTAIYLIWKDPYMAVGSDTFINEMMRRCGLGNLVSESRYPVLTKSRLKELNPELVLLSSEPFPFKAEHLEELRQSLPNTNVMLVDGEFFSWYGSRLFHSPEYFKALMAGWGG
ncbi:MAG: helical backbone metal receptor [Flavobacteriales bacterium]|nr:helical backbone metal receptor [Flavobacteriales bacterium]